MGLHGTTWDYMGLHGTTWDYMGLHGTKQCAALNRSQVQNVRSFGTEGRTDGARGFAAQMSQKTVLGCAEDRDIIPYQLLRR